MKRYRCTRKTEIVEHEKIVWHTAYADVPRITLGYVIYDEGIWKNAVEEIAGTDLVWPLAPYDKDYIK